jgi:Domain of unknown function (DUF1848)
MGPISTGNAEGLLYSLSRWTDLPIAKWPWFCRQMEQGFMLGVDPRTAMPGLWSLKREDTLGMVFWTKNPTNLIEDAHILNGYPLVIHITLTGWVEVEQGAPNIKWGLQRMAETVETFGPHRVVWRFSPVPMVPDAVGRFERIAREVKAMGIQQVYVAFLQDNDLMAESRTLQVRRDLLCSMADMGMDVLVCNEDRVFDDPGLSLPPNLRYGVCEDGSRFTGWSGDISTEGCGCALSVDPFTINESCSMGCEYCYAADRDLATERRDTTRKSLQVVR